MAYTYVKYCRFNDKWEDIHVNLVRKSHTLLSRRVLIRVIACLEGTYLRARGSFPRIRSAIYEFGLVENAVVFRGWRRARLRWRHRSVGSRGIGRHPVLIYEARPALKKGTPGQELRSCCERT